MEVTFRLSIEDENLPSEGEFLQVPILVNLSSEGIVGFEMTTPMDGVVTVDIDYLSLPEWEAKQ